MKGYFANKISKLKIYFYLFFVTFSASNIFAVYAQQLPDYSLLVERTLPSVVTIRTVINQLAQEEASDECDCGELNALDIVLIVNMILGVEDTDLVADMNNDGGINIQDIVLLLNLILS